MHTSTGKPKVLMVDDDLPFRELVCLQLRRDFIVWPAPDGLQAHLKAKQARPDVMVLDLQMPVWDGMQTLRAFRETDELKAVPIIILTADASRESVTRAIEEGVDDYLLKPEFCPLELARRIHRILDRCKPGQTR